MDLSFKNIRKTISKRFSGVKNSMNLPTMFLRNGGKMRPSWVDVVIDDRDLYTGYGYAIIKNRASTVASVAVNNVGTNAKDPEFVHPYLQKINDSPYFTPFAFWNNISTYLDLEGMFYLMAVRAEGADNFVGEVKYFKLLNPYHVEPIRDNDTKEIIGYIEKRDGLLREIPASMIIPIFELNPFDESKPFAMTDAFKDSQFTLKTADNYTRHALKYNQNAPGIIGTKVEFDSETEFLNFKKRILEHTHGEPIFANGDGITWTDTQQDLNKTALRDITEVNRELSFAVGGVSKTQLGIEQSGVTRDTARVQKELNIESQILPRIQLIIDSLNQDYKSKYPTKYAQTEAVLVVHNPLGVDYEAQIKEANAKKEKFELYKTMVSAGVEPEIASKYIDGDIDMSEIQIETTQPQPQVEKDTEEDGAVNAIKHNCNCEGKHNNSLRLEGIVDQQRGALQNEIVNIQARLVAGMINRLHSVGRNDLSDDIQEINDLLTKTNRNTSIRDLTAALVLFYGFVAMISGNNKMDERQAEFGLLATFSVDKAVTDNFKILANKVATGHIDTIATDIYETARQAAINDKNVREIESLLMQKFGTDISEARAKVIARTETNRAFTITQYEADKQFMEQNDLKGRVFKKWRTNSENPCEFCVALSKEEPIPLDDNFRTIGGSVSAGDHTFGVDFMDLEAGNLHPNCNCDYELIIEGL